MAAQVAAWEGTSGPKAGAAPAAVLASAAPTAGPIALPDPAVPAVVPTASFDDCMKRAEMARNQGLFGKALEWADQAIVSDSKKHHGWLAKADALFGLRRMAEAAAHAKKATELQPGFPPAWIRLASSLDLLNAPEQALPAWDKAVELAGQNVLTWDGKGVCLAKLGRIEEALAVHDKSLAIDAILKHIGSIQYLQHNLAVFLAPLNRTAHVWVVDKRTCLFNNLPCHNACEVRMVLMQKFSEA